MGVFRIKAHTRGGEFLRSISTTSSCNVHLGILLQKRIECLEEFSSIYIAFTGFNFERTIYDMRKPLRDCIVTFQNRLDESPSSLRLTIRTPGEQNPRVSVPIPKTSSGKEKVAFPEGKLSDAHGALLATIVAEVSGTRFESPPVWIVQEDRLTHEPGGGSSSSKGRIEETGEGLPEFLDEIGRREGVAAIAEFLRQLDIKFYDGSSGGPNSRRFRVRITDPFESDRVPDWLIQAKANSEDVGAAILDFVERHDKRKLHKHASRGNINGMENFLDILTTLAPGP